MSAKTAKTMTIWDRIAAKLELSDSDKLKKFFMREKKASERTIKTLTKNKEVLKMNYDNDLSDLQDALEDAKGNHEDAKEAIVPENVGNNSDMDAFSSAYWTNLDYKFDTVKSIKQQIADLEEGFSDEVDAIDRDIKRYQDRIDICNEKK